MVLDRTQHKTKNKKAKYTVHQELSCVLELSKQNHVNKPDFFSYYHSFPCALTTHLWDKRLEGNIHGPKDPRLEETH